MRDRGAIERRIALVAGVASVCTVGRSTAVAADVDFGREVRPLLAESCFGCHGPDEKARKGGLRLDRKEGMFSARPEGEPAVVPGREEVSPLYQRLVADDEADRMPPVKSGKRLTPVQIETIRRWISQGAPWTE